ncbi:MAG: PCMD domain-containing protein, partial [Bacteroidales bacterium]|nr:PCMD domain-containing protein [Bacteroidales bacterium]
VFYRNTDAAGRRVTLYGDDVLTSPHVVAVARMTDMAPAGHWTAFEMAFSYLGDVDPELLKENGYNFTIVFSSSFNGAMFEGAVGSTLLIDKVRIICETEE